MKLSAAIGIAFVLASAGIASATEIDIDATSSAGVTQSFDMGTYNVDFLSQNQGGTYSAWSPFGSNDQWWDQVELTIGKNTFLYKLQNSDGSNEYFPTRAASISAYKAAESSGTLAEYENGTYVGDVGQIAFTINKASNDVNFKVADSNYKDNLGGVSLDVEPADSAISAAPEPGAWALMMLGVGAIGAMLGYRKRVLVDHKAKLAAIG